MLAPGAKLGPYEILGPLGAGGMGEVYRARDTRLGRDVAVKVLPAHLASSPELRQRFEREARAVSSLNHPHICTLHDVGREGDTDFLVMEHMEGETLAARLERGPLAVDLLLRTGIEIADALDRAHRSGIVHRDLKPGNVMLTKTGAKLMDFGLARGASPVAGPIGVDLSQTPTVHQPLTAEGTLIGTFQYMAPEQLEGRETDARTDLFAFGATLYEMATGKKAFAGKSQASLISAIMTFEPPAITTVAPMLPPALERLVRACLAKEPDERIQTAHDVKLQLQWIRDAGSQAGVPAPVAERRKSRERLAWVVAGVAVALAAMALLFPGLVRRSQRPLAARATVAPPAGMQISGIPGDAAISPDGRTIVFAASDPTGKSRLWLRPLDALDARPIAGTEFTGVESPGLPFWSPDGRSIGFFADDKLKTIPIAGGSPQVLCSASNARGGTWNREGVILFAPSSQGPLFRVSQSGGAPTQVTFFDATRHETAHRFPRFLPDGRHFLFVALPTEEGKLGTWVGELGSKDRALVASATSAAVFVPPGHLAYVRGQSLMTQPFDLGRWQVTGEPVRIGDAPEDLSTLGTNPASASENGILIYPTSAPVSSRLTWFDRDGKALGELPVPEGGYLEIAFSPDNRRIALSRRNPSTGNDIWIADASRGALSRLTTDESRKDSLTWSGDGSRIAYNAQRGAAYNFCERPASGSDEERPLFASSSMFMAMSQLTRDGAYLVFDDLERTTQRDLWVVPLKGDRKPVPYLRTPFNETGGSISPDGRFMLYQSDESGRTEMYVQSFPVPGQKVRISTDGAAGGAWRDDGAEILYRSQKGLMSVSVRSGPTFEAAEPKLLMALPKESVALGITSDFKRFLFALATSDAPRVSLTLLTNWTSLLER
jgi:Tol biopolymer transport system component